MCFLNQKGPCNVSTRGCRKIKINVAEWFSLFASVPIAVGIYWTNPRMLLFATFSMHRSSVTWKCNVYRLRVLRYLFFHFSNHSCYVPLGHYPWKRMQTCGTRTVYDTQENFIFIGYPAVSGVQRCTFKLNTDSWYSFYEGLNAIDKDITNCLSRDISIYYISPAYWSFIQHCWLITPLRAKKRGKKSEAFSIAITINR